MVRWVPLIHLITRCSGLIRITETRAGSGFLPDANFSIFLIFIIYIFTKHTKLSIMAVMPTPFSQRLEFIGFVNFERHRQNEFRNIGIVVFLRDCEKLYCYKLVSIFYTGKQKGGQLSKPIANLSLFTACKRSLGQGNIFTPVCHSVHKRGVPGPEGCLVRECLVRWGVCFQEGA